MSGTEKSLTELLEETLVLAAQRQDGQTYGLVNSYDPTKQRANVTPLIPRLVVDELEVIATIPNVPVEWPETTTHSIKMPLGTGSRVRLVVLGHDHDQWIVTGTPNVRPQSDRRFSLSDLVAIPATVQPFAETADPLSYDAAWGVLGGGWFVGDNTGTLVALASLVLTELQAIKTWADAHVHTETGGTTSTPTVPMPAPSSVACTKLKAK